MKLRGETALPGDKSISHRALLIGALATGRSHVEGLSNAADPRSTASCLRDLGIQIDISDKGTTIHGRGRTGFRAPTRSLDCGNSGTTMRLLAGILAGHSFRSMLVGDESLTKRPMQRIAQPLRDMGASVLLSAEGTAPVEISGRSPLRSIRYRAQFPSAQVKSAVLFAGLSAEGETEVIERIATRDHTERMMGLQVSDSEEGKTVKVRGGSELAPIDMHIPGDISSAVFLIAGASLLPGSEILLQHVGVNPGRTRVLSLLRSWGVSVAETNLRESGGEPLADLVIRAGWSASHVQLTPEDVPLCIDEIPALACLAMAAGVSFTVQGASELRSKETDRIERLVTNFKSLGLVVDETADGFSFEAKRDLRSAKIITNGDHRIAMAFSVAALIHPGIVIDDPECVAVSFPEFFATLTRLSERT